MEKENAVARIYELLELYDFEELPENEKPFILKHFSQSEYSMMRSTIVDTKALFLKFPETRRYRFLTLKRIAVYPIELYKIAAALIIVFGIAYTISKIQSPDQTELMAIADTVYIERKDSVVITKTNILEGVKERIVYKDFMRADDLIDQTNTATGNESFQRDCSRDICPNDMSLLSRIKTKSDFSKDTSLIDFIVALN